MRGPARTTSGVTADGHAYFLKRLSPASDGLMRVTGDHAHRPYRVWPVRSWRPCSATTATAAPATESTVSRLGERPRNGRERRQNRRARTGPTCGDSHPTAAPLSEPVGTVEVRLELIFE